MQNTATAEQRSEPNFFDLTDIEITLTYDFLKQAQPMKFFLRLQMAKEERDVRQSYFGLSEEQRELKNHEHNVIMLSMLATRPPENVPTFPDDPADLAAAIREFFLSSNPMKRKLVLDVMTLYYARIQPQEFFR